MKALFYRTVDSGHRFQAVYNVVEFLC